MSSRGVNLCMFVGNLGADPEMRYTPSGRPVARFRIAVNRAYKDRQGEVHEDVTWVPVVVWGALAETCTRYLTKGRQVSIVGQLRNRSWNGQDGQKRYWTEIVASQVVFLGSGREREEEALLEEEEEAAGEEGFAEEEGDLPL